MAALDSDTATIPESALQNGGLVVAVKRVTKGRERLIVTRRGKPAYALVPLEDLAVLESHDEDVDPEQDRLDGEESARRIAEVKAKGGRFLSHEEVCKALGL